LRSGAITREMPTISPLAVIDPKAELARDVAVMYSGRIVEHAPARKIFEEPEHPYTWGLLRSIPRLTTPRGEELVPIPGRPPSLINRPSGCHFHPRCPDAMQICAQRHPVDRDHGGGHRAQCWATDLAEGLDLGEHEKAPLTREEIAVADEA